MRSNSISTICSVNSTVSAAEFEPTIQIFVKTISGEIIPLTLPTSTTLQTLENLLSLRTNIPTSDLRLSYSGRHLSPTVSTSAAQSTSAATLASLALPADATLQISLPLRGGMPPKRQKCQFKDCKDAAQRIVGDCGFCQGHFCGKHRMLESHNCSGLEDCKKEEKERNREKLESERTVAIRGI